MPRKSRSLRFVRNSRRKKKQPKTDIEQIVEGWLVDHEIPHTLQAPIGRCHVDVLLENKTIVEINGCYWHGCPKCYPEPKPKDLKKLAKDKRRYLFFLNAGYSLLLLWGCEIQKEPAKTLKRLIKAAK